MTMLDDFTLRADQAAALYLDLSNAELDATGLAMLEEQERRRQQKILKYVQADIDRVVAAMVKPDDMVCPEKPRTVTRAELKEIEAELRAKPATPATEAGEWRRWARCNYCERQDGRVFPAGAKDTCSVVGQEVRCGCGNGTCAVIQCDSDGRELPAEGRKRWFKSRDASIYTLEGDKCFWVDGPRRVQQVGVWKDRDLFGWADEITESEALALLGKSDA